MLTHFFPKYLIKILFSLYNILSSAPNRIPTHLCCAPHARGPFGMYVVHLFLFKFSHSQSYFFCLNEWKSGKEQSTQLTFGCYHKSFELVSDYSIWTVFLLNLFEIRRVQGWRVHHCSIRSVLKLEKSLYMR